jgi:hypothetical protein
VPCFAKKKKKKHKQTNKPEKKNKQTRKKINKPEIKQTMNMFEWEEDNFSFEDSDRFEEVSKDY